MLQSYKTFMSSLFICGLLFSCVQSAQALEVPALAMPFAESAAQRVPDAASAHGKYSDLIQVMNCPADGSKYGNYKDYGWWGGGPWCGQQGTAGFWVWVAPNWYIWKQKVTSPPQQPSAPPQASVQGKYYNLIQVLNCPADGGKYGNFKDYGWWGGGPWCGKQGKAGYWVWVAPSWYIWKDRQ